ncbi:patatin-like phospholipase family protein [Rhodopseudomonas pseudopalustris]|uniref:Patatin-like phospholipase n=1 Tax=Rhodopseudomonas pseudopalustris TaxID=1513892 RepID=A0A1H8XAY9_9BRAD|nr:patatin-like phospholipase family protein [Rhodopseudomonas pseudopalustris]SEP37042.1 Patatin-like phospholipase [Rhodopseudomonas pseudopalustris]
MSMEIKPFRVLSLDGGGMRGTYTATYLDQVASAFARRRKIGPLDMGASFNLIVGTSTGGIIACALAAGVPLSKVVDLYRLHGAAIFRRPLPSNLIGAVPDSFRRPAALAEGEAALQLALENVLGHITLKDIYEQRGIALAITAVEMSQHHAWVFKTPHFADTTHRDDAYTLAEVCLATSAAPIFRSMAAINHADNGGKGYNVFVDGGLWANNPVLVALIEALDIAEPGQPIEIYCLGTCPVPAGEQIARENVHRGLPDWQFGGDVAALSIDAQQFAYDHMAKKLARHFNRLCTIIRFPADKVPAALIPYLDLDDTREEAINALINQARTDADMTNSKCAYRDRDPEAAMICSLFNSAPERTEPPMKRRVSLEQGPTTTVSSRKDDTHV